MSDDETVLGSCRHCGHTPVHSSARSCPWCGGIAPYTRTPPPRSKNAIVAIIAVVFLILLAMVALWYGGK